MKDYMGVGLYRRYDDEYVIVLQECVNAYSLKKEVVFQFVGKSGLHSLTSERFFSDEYDVIVSGEKGIEKYKKKIVEHPDNVTGQKCTYMKVKDLKKFGKNLSTEELLCELKKREDSPLYGLDIEGLNERVAVKDYIVGVLSKGSVINGREVLPSVVVECIDDTLEEARKNYAKLKIRGQDKVKIFKRTFVEIE